MRLLSDIAGDSGVVFGTSGARGLVDAFTPTLCAAYMHAFVNSMRSRFVFNQIVLAIDLRPSSPDIASYCASALAQLGIEVVFCGAMPTPALAHFAIFRKIPAVMITGSHIPFDRNGLKFYRPDGEISKHDEQQMLRDSLPSSTMIAQMPLPETKVEAKQMYLRRYLDSGLPLNLSGVRVGVYQHSSVCRDLLVELLREAGADVISLARTDTFVPVDTEAVSKQDIVLAQEWSQQYHLDYIVSTDGDGDRPMIADEHGQWLRGDVVGILTACALGIAHLSVPVSCTTSIEKSGLFKSVLRTKIGSPYVIASMEELMQQYQYDVAGFEANGGFMLASHLMRYPNLQPLPTRDAVLPIIAIIAHTVRQGIRLSDAVASLPRRFTYSNRLQDVPSERSLQLIRDWTGDLDACLQVLGVVGHVVQHDQTDGLRMLLDNGNIIHLRPSGNAPELRCYAESDSSVQAEQLVAQVLSKVASL